ncbi:MAG: FAD-dependent oxidoreductase [Anaerolineae bacterium]|nr:FAD-dependent oxidoreductase [Anaerolineae bacterium]
MDRYEVIVVGAGVGGLSAAAHLAQAGIRTLVIEQTAFPGGRCYSRTLDGVEYDIGALYLGGSVPGLLRDVLGLNCRATPFRAGIAVDDKLVSFPFDGQTVRQLRACGVSKRALAHFLLHVPRLFSSSTFERYESVDDILRMLTADETIRFMGNVLYGVSGTSPRHLPSNYARLNGTIAGYRATNPQYLEGGNRAVADLLVQEVRKYGRIQFGERAECLMIEGQRVGGVVTGRRTYRADFVISNADIRTTVLGLCDAAIWPDDYRYGVEMLRRPLSVASVFMTFTRDVQLPQGYGVFFVADDPISEFQCLEDGHFPSQSMFILYVPTQILHEHDGQHRATLQFYYPRGDISPEVLDRQVRQIMAVGLDRLWPRFSECVTAYKVYSPERYFQEFGLHPYVFGVSPALGQRRYRVRTPIPNLFCVGDSVQPEGPCVPQAMESGFAAARLLLEHRRSPVAH